MSKVQASPSTSPSSPPPSRLGELVAASNVRQASSIPTGGNISTHAHDRRALSTPFTVACGTGDSSDDCGQRLADALAGTEAVLQLDNGTYTHSSTFTIGRDVTVRAKNAGQAILDGENTRGVMVVSSGIVDIEGVHITKGNVSTAVF